MRFQNLLKAKGARGGIGLLAALLMVAPTNAPAQPLKLEELVRKHLESIGTAERRRAMENYVIRGTGSLVCQRGCVGSLQGPATVASGMGKRLFAMKFPSVSYPGERFVFTGKGVEVAKLPEAKYTLLGVFFYDNRVFLTEGLVGGTLTQGWPLLDLEGRKPRLNYRGLKKVDGQMLHEVEFRPRAGRTDFNIRLYFEPDTFHHVMTRYETALSGLAEDTVPHRIVERFTDFETEDGLTLPHGYAMQFDGPSAMLQWTMRLTGFHAEAEIDPAMFNVSFNAQ